MIHRDKLLGWDDKRNVGANGCVGCTLDPAAHHVIVSAVWSAGNSEVDNKGAVYAEPGVTGAETVGI